jgi:hypothetical protein
LLTSSSALQRIAKKNREITLPNSALKAINSLFQEFFLPKNSQSNLHITPSEIFAKTFLILHIALHG